jgi:TatD DNase family protein
MKITVPVIIHGFSKNQQVAKQLIDNGFYLSFGKYLLRNPELESVFQSIPNDKFFLETDTIEETLDEVYNLAANYKNINLPDLIEIINSNFNFVFNKSNNLISLTNQTI